MDKQFDELSKSLAEDGVSRREALRKIGSSLVGILLACFGLGNAKPAFAGSMTCCAYTCGKGLKWWFTHRCVTPGQSCPVVEYCFLHRAWSVADCNQCTGL